jgi:sugar O-acyltransferase (sialic acid O-acetyltransferase NeuD family)
MKRTLAVYGAGGHAQVVIDALHAAGAPPESVFDDDPANAGRSCLGHTVSLPRLEPAHGQGAYTVVVAIARNDVRRRLARDLEARGLALAGVRHPSAIVSRHAQVAETAQLMAGAVIQAGARVGHHAVVNTGAIVDHDSVVGDFAHVGPGAVLAGAVELGEGAFVGTGASVIPFVKLGAWCTVGAGAAVIRDVPDGATVAGVPARLVEQAKEAKR